MAQQPKKPKLTPKQSRFVQGVAMGKSGTQAYKDAYNTTNSKVASVEASRLLAKPSIQEVLEPIYAKYEINLESAIAPIGKSLKALKQNEYTGEVVEDLKLQLQASDRALKLLGVNGSEGQTININFNQIAQEQREKYGI